MKRTVYSIVSRRKAWLVCAEGRVEPLAIYLRRDDALRYVQEAVRQRNEIYDDRAVVNAPLPSSPAVPPSVRPVLRLVQ